MDTIKTEKYLQNTTAINELSYNSLPLSNNDGSDAQRQLDRSKSEQCMEAVDASTKTTTMTMEDALEQLNISYSPVSQSLQKNVQSASSPPVTEDENNQYTYYKPGHRKAYSLPRTLEGVDDDGSISHPKVEHDVVVESPRTTLQRYGIPYQPYNFKGDEDDSVVSASEVSGVSGGVSDHSSVGDSGVYSETSDRTREKKGFSEFLSKGFAANLKLLSRSGQQMVKLVKGESDCESVSPCVSSQSLIMETRPPGVPAKTPKEEEKHKQEHQAMMEKMKKREESEGRTRAQKLAEKRRMEDDLSELTSHWTNSIIPNWSSTHSSKKTQSLWWRGLPPPVRGRVWRLGLSNTLNLTPQLYSILVQRARDQLKSTETCLGREETLELIRLDVSRTFPQLCIFQNGGPYYQLLHNVLGAYVCYRPDIGYVQGMSFIAAILILNLDEADAFIMFANILNWPLLAAFFTVDQTEMEKYYSKFTHQLQHYLPKLASHFSSLGMKPELFLLDWIMTLYSRCCPLDVVCRIWDMIIRDGDHFLTSAALGILSLYQETLLAETDFILIAQFLSKLPDDINCDLLFDKIEGVSGSPSTVKRAFPSLSSFW